MDRLEKVKGENILRKLNLITPMPRPIVVNICCCNRDSKLPEPLRLILVQLGSILEIGESIYTRLAGDNSHLHVVPAGNLQSEL